MHRLQNLSHLKKAKSRNNLRRHQEPQELYKTFEVKIKRILPYEN